MMDSRGSEQLDARLNRAEIALARLESRSPGPISKWAGLVGLCIAILTGGFTLYEKLIVEPEARMDAEVRSASDDVAEITRINSSLLQMSRSMPPDQFAMVAATENGRKFSLAQRATRIFLARPEEVAAEDLIVLANEHWQLGDGGTALKLSAQAQENATNPRIRLTAQRYAAGSRMYTEGRSTPAVVRRAYEEVLRSAEQLGPPENESIIAETLRDWAIGEAINGRCNESSEIVARIEERISKATTPAFTLVKQQATQDLAARGICQRAEPASQEVVTSTQPN
jgi:hypothetical protein